MPAKLAELTLIYCAERIRWDQTAIIDCVRPNEPAGAVDWFGVVVKCDCPPDELVRGLSYRFYGHWVEHPKHGRQFLAKTYVRCQPHGRAGTIRYLTTTCAGHGLGQKTACVLWDKFGGDAVRVLREQPDVAVAAVGLGHFTAEKAEASAKLLKDEAALEDVSIDLIDLLGGRGFGRDTAKKCVQEWGNRAAEFVRRSPYLLMRFRGAGFLRCDQLYLDLGGDPVRLKRQAYSAWYSVARDTDGHTWFRPELVEQGLQARISGSAVDVLAALKLARRARILAVRRDEKGEPWVAEGRKAKNETTVAERVREMLAERDCCWPEVDGLDVSDHQREHLGRATERPIGVLGGSPGTGKTYTLARLVGRIVELCGADLVAVAAPTGKAAVRISEALDGYGVPKTASTIHRLLGVQSRTAGDGWGFKHNETNPLPHKFVILDEASMVDTDLAASLLRALAIGTHLLLVGDVNQLLPVGHGAPLRDLIAAGVPCGELTKIERNWGRIVQACADIRDGKRWESSADLDPDAGENLKLIPAAGGEQTVEKIVATIRTIREQGLFDPIWGVQVIVAVNKKSPLSRKEKNKRLQGELNPGGARAGSNPFRVGDKIVCLKNSLMPVVEDAPADTNRDASDGKVFVANGELARVVSVAEKLTTVSLDAPKRLVKIPRGAENGDGQADGQAGGENGDESDHAASSGTGCQWDLAYAISCHKSQGSEFPCVIVALDEYPGARRLCTREWLYTAISRAKGICLMVGKRSVADGMCLTRAVAKRKTFLKELIVQ